MIKKHVFCLLIILLSIKVFAQQTALYTNELADYNTAYKLYANDQYLLAQKLFSEILGVTENETIKSKSAYYSSVSAIKLNQQNADQLVKLFLKEYPASLHRKNAYFNLANYYFKNKKYSEALKWYGKIHENSLTILEEESLSFHKGYSFFMNKQYAEAKIAFNKLLNSKKYGSQAKYYLGYIAYESDNYKEANNYFEDLKNEERYSDNLSYYQADMNFKLGNFQKAIDLGLESYKISRPYEKSELSKIIGESYFNLESYEEATFYLKNYKGKNGKWNNVDYYQLGYVYFKQQDYQNAINEFNKIIDGNNAVAQNAFYHLANSYLKLEQKQQALNAFKSASEMDFSPEMKEDAFLNYAKLSYQIGNSYQNVFDVLGLFINNYPKNEQTNEIKELLLDSYISSKNYQSAIELLENNTSFKNRSAYQKATFFRGLELYNEGKHKAALQVLQKSLNEPIDAVVKIRAIYWMSECNYQLLNFDTSLIGFKKFLQSSNAFQTPEIITINYNLGYT